MIIKCDKCQTSFKIPDEKIKSEGTKVRCSKCKNIFTIYPLKQTAKVEEELFEEKTRIGFIPTPFGEDKDDDKPIIIKKYTEDISSSVETLGHGITFSSVEIKKIEEPTQNLNEIMSSIESGIRNQIPQISDIMGSITQNSDLPDSATPSRQSEFKADTLQNDLSPDIGSLLDGLSDIQTTTPTPTQTTPADSPPEELPDLSTLLSAQEQTGAKDHPKEQIAPIPEINELLSIPSVQESPKNFKEPTTPDIKTVQTEPAPKQTEKVVEDKLSIDIDKVFDSLFAEAEPSKGIEQSPQQEKQSRKTMLYMEAVPVAPQNSAQLQSNQKVSPHPSSVQQPISTGSGAPETLQIQDNLLSDDLSMFLSPIGTPQSSNQSAPPIPTLNIGDDLLSAIPVSQNKVTPSSPEPISSGGLLDDSSSFSFGELGADLGTPQKTDETGRFSPNANRSDDLLSQMDSIDNIQIPSPQVLPSIPRPEVKKPPREEINIVTTNEAKAVHPESPKIVAPLKPATIALKETQKDIKGEIIKWLFTLLLGGIIILFILSPSYIFPEINGTISSVINNPLPDNSISIENLYYKQLNKTDTLLVFSGYISLKKPLPPDSITLLFRISDLSGSEIVQIEYPPTYSEKHNDVLIISNMNEVKDFLQNNRIKIITQKKSIFITPLIISNIDITRIDVKASIKIRSQ